MDHRVKCEVKFDTGRFFGISESGRRGGQVRLSIKIFFAIAIFSLTAKAGEEEKCDFSVGADIVSTYVWRGSYQAGTSIQPAMEFTVGGFSAGAWGSVDIAGFGYKEVDLMASYSFQNFTAGLTNYWVGGEGNYNYFDFSNTTIHLLEINFLYSFDCFPLTLGWNTIIAGDEMYTKYENNRKLKKAFPTYLEATYAFQMKEVHLDVALGVSPWKSSTMYNRFDEGGRNDGFSVINLAMTASKKIKITDRYSLTFFGQLVLNPSKEDVFFVCGIKF